MVDITHPSFAYLPFQILAYFHPKFRQNRDWTYRQALLNSILKAGLKNYTALRVTWPIPLREGHDNKGRFVRIQPAASRAYTGVAKDKVVQPEATGATWYPEPYPHGNTSNVMLHFHGGSYVLGDGRPSSTKFLAKMLLANTPCSHLLCPQYRLAYRSEHRFPAQLQDAISAYMYLLHTLEIPSSQIVLSGDSSGGHLVLALLRYISDLDDALLPPPKCALAWSPWCDIPAAQSPDTWERSRNYRTEFIPSSFPRWGAASFLDGVEMTSTVEKYVVPLKHPFHLPAPVMIGTGDKEVLFEEHQALATRFQRLAGAENTVEIVVAEGIPHDILMIAWILGFKAKAIECAEKAGIFISKVERLSSCDLNSGIGAIS